MQPIGVDEVGQLTGGRTVREWLSGQSFAQQYDFGMDITSLIQRGATLP